MARDQRLRDDAIARAYPAFADIPDAECFRTPSLPRPGWSRLANVLDRLRVAVLAQPDQPLAEMRQVLARQPLHRKPADIYRLHGRFVEEINAAQARRLIAPDDRLLNEAPKGERLASDDLSP